MKLENPFRVTVKFMNGDLRDYYTLYAENLEEAKKIASTKYKESEEAYNFKIYNVKPLVFNPKLR
jgi:hypothetical protein